MNTGDVPPGLPRDRAPRARDAQTEVCERTRVVTRINTLIRPEPWISWLLVATGVLLWGAMIWVGWTIDHSDSGLKQVLGLQSGRLTGLFGAVCLLGATQLSLVTLWYRTRSRKDFQGRYRIWIWSSLIWGTLFSAAISGWHLGACERIARHLPGRLQPAALNVWLLAATVLVATAIRLLLQEFGKMKATNWLLGSAKVVAGATLLLSLDSGLDSTPAIGELQAGLAALWPLLIASALLHHARYVIHVSNEVAPSPSRPSRLSPIVQQVWTEVLSLGPSRAGLASWLDPRHLRTVVSRAWKIASSLVRTTLLRRSDQVRKQRSESRSGDRRKAAMPIPTIAAPADSSAKPPHKSVAMSLQSVSRS